MDVVIVYSLIEIARSGAARLLSSRTPDDISADTVDATAGAFLTACPYAKSVLPKLRTGVAEHDQRDAELMRRIEEARSLCTRA
jgi:hypothetical protein